MELNNSAQTQSTQCKKKIYVICGQSLLWRIYITSTPTQSNTLHKMSFSDLCKNLELVHFFFFFLFHCVHRCIYCVDILLYRPYTKYIAASKRICLVNCINSGLIFLVPSFYFCTNDFPLDIKHIILGSQVFQVFFPNYRLNLNHK